MRRLVTICAAQLLVLAGTAVAQDATRDNRAWTRDPATALVAFPNPFPNPRPALVHGNFDPRAAGSVASFGLFQGYTSLQSAVAAGADTLSLNGFQTITAQPRAGSRLNLYIIASLTGDMDLSAGGTGQARVQAQLQRPNGAGGFNNIAGMSLDLNRQNIDGRFEMYGVGRSLNQLGDDFRLAVQTTVVVPTGNILPLGGWQIAFTT